MMQLADAAMSSCWVESDDEWTDDYWEKDLLVESDDCISLQPIHNKQTLTENSVDIDQQATHLKVYNTEASKASRGF